MPRGVSRSPRGPPVPPRPSKSRWTSLSASPWVKSPAEVLPFLRKVMPALSVEHHRRVLPEYDGNTGKAIGGGLPPIGVIAGLLLGLVGVGALLVYGLQ